MLYSIYHFLAQIPPYISWSKKRKLTSQQKDEIAELLASGYYVILTGTKSHLSSVIVSFMSWVKLKTWSKYSHALMNCDFLTDPKRRDEFKFLEATVVGVHYSTFDEIFDCDYVCLLSPKNIDNEEWTCVIDALIKEDGKPYDDLFDLSDSSKISCVELVLGAFKSIDKYKDDFRHLEKMIEEEDVLLPVMFRQSEDFILAWSSLTK